MKKNIIIGALLLIIGFVIGILCRPDHFRDEVKMVERDTTFIVDTHIIEKPVMVDRVSKETIMVAVHDTTIVNDTIYVPLLIEKKIYKGEEYYAEVSGYQPSLDKIEVYPKTVAISKTETTTQMTRHSNHLRLGIEANYYSTPFIPIYLEYERMLHRNASFYARVLYNIPSRTYGFGLGAKVSIGW